jgi:DNA primase
MTSVDIKQVRDTVDIVRVAEWLGLTLSKKFMGEQLRSPCPIHDGGKRALVITPSINRYYCFANECREGGDAVQLTAKVLKIPMRDAALKLQSQFLNGTYRQDFSPQEKLAKVEDKMIFEHEEVRKLGLTPERAKQLGIGWMPGGTMPKRLLVPVRTREGDTIGYIGIPSATELKVPKAWHNA